MEYYYLFFIILAVIIGGLLFQIYRSSDYHQVCVLK